MGNNREVCWYIGETTRGQAETVLSNEPLNVFVVYKEEQKNLYIFCTRYLVSDLDDITEYLTIDVSGDGKFRLPNQKTEYENIVECVLGYAATFKPHLLPIKSPPPYSRVAQGSQSSRQNQGRQHEGLPDASLATIGRGANNAAACSQISPSAVCQSQWLHYPHLRRCHPKNVCYGCCYSNSEFFLPYKKGPLRVMSVIMMWLFCFPCILSVVLFCFLPNYSR
eukprot:Em0006g909a